jgi:hypothetical protein
MTEKQHRKLLRAHKARRTRIVARRKGYFAHQVLDDRDRLDVEYGWTQYRKLK